MVGLRTDTLPPPGFTTTSRSSSRRTCTRSRSPSTSARRHSVSIERGFAGARDAAARYGAPLWSGEWGWFGAPERDLARVERYLREEDRRGGRRVVGVEAGVRRPARGRGADLQRLAAPGHMPGGPGGARTEPYVRALTRAYPRYAPGRLTAIESDIASGRFRVAGGDRDAGGSCVLEVWVPRPGASVSATNVTGLAVATVPGGVLVTGCARDDYELRAEPAPGPAVARACRSRRVVVLRLRLPRGVRLVRARVAVRGARARRIRVRGGRRVVVDLRGARRGRSVVTVTGRRSDGRRHAERRAIRTCVPRRSGGA